MPNTDQNGRWHNIHFKRAALDHGLLAERDRRTGWGLTRLHPATIERIMREFRPDETKFNTFRPAHGSGGKPPTRLKLWICGCNPPVRVRVAIKNFDATCNRCGQRFRRAESSGGESVRQGEPPGPVAGIHATQRSVDPDADGLAPKFGPI